MEMIRRYEVTEYEILCELVQDISPELHKPVLVYINL
jgi:hypothetical protein